MTYIISSACYVSDYDILGTDTVQYWKVFRTFPTNLQPPPSTLTPNATRRQNIVNYNLNLHRREALKSCRFLVDYRV